MHGCVREYGWGGVGVGEWDVGFYEKKREE